MTESTSQYYFHKCVKRARKSLDLSQTELGDKLELKQGRISHIESGKQWMSETLFLDIAEALGMTPVELIAFGQDDPA